MRLDERFRADSKSSAVIKATLDEYLERHPRIDENTFETVERLLVKKIGKPKGPSFSLDLQSRGKGLASRTFCSPKNGPLVREKLGRPDSFETT